MRRRFVVEVDVVDTIAGTTFELLTRLVGELERMKREDLIIDYGIGLENDVTWLFSIAARAPKPEEPGHGAAEESKTGFERGTRNDSES